jgi:hypothetical protein
MHSLLFHRQKALEDEDPHAVTLACEDRSDVAGPERISKEDR